MPNQYTVAICPECGQTFNKHLNAIHCSTRCSNRAARRRRRERITMPPIATLRPVTTPTYDIHRDPTQPLPHDVLRNIEDRLVTRYQQNKFSTPEEFTPEELGDYIPHNSRIVLHEKPRVTDDEPRIIAMGHYETFGETLPAEEHPVTIATHNSTIRDLLNKTIPSK